MIKLKIELTKKALGIIKDMKSIKNEDNKEQVELLTKQIKESIVRIIFKHNKKELQMLKDNTKYIFKEVN